MIGDRWRLFRYWMGSPQGAMVYFATGYSVVVLVMVALMVCLDG